MRTWPEIVAYCNANDSIFNFRHEVAAAYAPLEWLEPLRYRPVPGEEWVPDPFTRERMLFDLADYLQFAWTKARDHRGLSAVRSVDKIQTWCYLLEDDEAVAFAQDGNNYPMYGAPILKYVSGRYRFELPQDPGVLRMAQGLACCEGCNQGCGI